MEGRDRQEDQFGQGGLNSRHRIQILLQRLHQVIKIIDRPPDDPGGTQEGWSKEKPQELHKEDRRGDQCGGKTQSLKTSERVSRFQHGWHG